MSIARRLAARIEYRCDICGRVGIWAEGSWRRFTSYLHDETVPQEELPHACGEDCARELTKRMRTGEMALPTITMRGISARVTKPGRGYGPFLVPGDRKPRRRAKSPPSTDSTNERTER